MTEADDVLKECEKLLESGNDIESVISFLRERAKSKLVSIKIVAQLLNVSISRAKWLVHTSATWKDVKERDESFSLMAADGLDQVAEDGIH